jgi:hypothetical protein
MGAIRRARIALAPASFANLTMPNRSNTPSLLRTRLSRRDWLGFAGKGAVGNTRGTRNTLNTGDGIDASLTTAEKAVLTPQTSPSGEGYAGVINMGVQVV